MTEVLHAPGPCSLCGRDPSVGFASVNDSWFCHGDDDPEPTCYMQAQAQMIGTCQSCGHYTVAEVCGCGGYVG